MRPELIIIAAVSERDRLIGDGLELPWRIPADFRRFKRLTTGHPLVMGRRTFESLLHQNGGPLPDRDNVVLTRHPMRSDHANVHVYGGLDEALAAFADRARVYIGGGGTVYAQTLERADRLELTLVEGAFEGDAYFPPYEHLLGTVFRREGCEAHPAQGTTPAFRFETWVRQGAPGRRA